MNEPAQAAHAAESRAPWVSYLAAISGALAFLLFIAVPLLPVKQTQSSFSWPQNESLNSINAPLVSVAPESLVIDLPLSSIDALREDQDLLIGTIPTSGPEASDRGLFVTYNETDGLSVTVANEVVFEMTTDDVEQERGSGVLHIETTGDRSVFEVEGTSHSEESEEDLRPQVTGIYTELDDTSEAYRALKAQGLSAQVEVNSRFTTAPTLTKQLAMWGGTILALISLAALWLGERRRPTPSQLDNGSTASAQLERGRWLRPRPIDAIVVSILGYWHIFGANTSDDGFILSMARTSTEAGYMANYYRWYGVPEAPFGSPLYELLAFMTELGANSLWMRVPTLLAGIGIWLLLSREILPRLGPAINGRRLAHWTAALMFLSFWLPYNNGIRPEPIIAFGTLATWALFERAIAADRFTPAAWATVIATITLTCGPTGLAAVGVFLVSLPSMVRMLNRRLEEPHTGPTWRFGASIVGPFLAAGTFVMVPVFADQTLAAVRESTRVRGIVGPALDWYSEYVRYATLLDQTVDGSLTRRFAMLTMLICMGLVLYSLMRNGQVVGAATGPTVRLMTIMGMSMFFLTFTPTKWTHHFGIYAGLAGAIAALGAVVLSQVAMRSPRIRTFCLAALGLLMAVTFAGWNGWWYVSSFGVPWWDKTPQLKGVEFTTLILFASLAVLALGVMQNFRHEYRRSKAQAEGRLEKFDAADRAEAVRFRTLLNAPIAFVSALVVLFSLLTFAKAFIDQYPAYSVGMGNVRALAGDTDYLADEAMIETNTNDSFLSPVNGLPLADSLESEEISNFTPSGIPESIIPETQAAANVGAIANSPATDSAPSSSASDATNKDGTTAPAQDSTTDENESEDKTSNDSSDSRTPTTDVTGGKRSEKGVNGSQARLPFNLDFRKVPVVGSYKSNPTGAARLTTSWYELPEATEEAPLLVVSVAGRIAHHDQNGVAQPGQELMLEYGKRNADGSFELLGEKEMLDIGPTPTWRNLRLPLKDLPEEADVVRLKAEDVSLAERDWIAVTPPRVPKLTRLSDVYDVSTPALLDWTVALQFPRLRTFNHYAGIAEIPEYRIAPDSDGKATLTGFMDYYGGGALATVEAVNTSYEVPSYTRGDWHRDWGSIERYELRQDSTGTTPDLATIDYDTIVRSGLWQESQMKIRDPEKS